MMSSSNSTAAASRVLAHVDRRYWIGLFVALQYLPAALLFVPGGQSIRLLIRAVPYLASLGLLLVCWRMPAPRKAFLGRAWLAVALGLLVLNLMHPDTYAVTGLAQCAFQICIAAPALWGDRLVTGTREFERLLWLLFLANVLSASLGLLQVFYPATFMPPEFTRLGRSLNSDFVESLSFEGARGTTIIRPPGLSDLPGGAAVAGATSGLLGLLLCLLPGQSLGKRLFCLGAANIGLFVLYVTQVRSLFLMVLFAFVVMALLLVRQKRPLHAAVFGGTAAALIAGAFLWAVTVGGETVAERFLGLAETGVVNSYKENRGAFVAHTFDEVLSDYPIGAGVGRWGMMSVNFGKWEPSEYRPIYVEIQMTGWILDGGALLFLLYGGALILTMVSCYRMCARPGDPALAYLAGVVFCLNLLVVGQAMAGPVFNTQLGMQFWLLAACLHGAAMRPRLRPARTRIAAVVTAPANRLRPLRNDVHKQGTQP
jgi:hypothetical protein